MNNKKIIGVLTALLIVTMALPVFAAEVTGDVTSKVDVESTEDDTTTTVTLADGTINVEGIEDLAASVGILNEMVIDGDTKTQVNPDVAYTGIENLTVGIRGIEDEIDDGFIWLEITDDATKMATDVYANYSMEAMEGLTVGADNNVELRNEDVTGDEATTILTVDPYANYAATVAEGLTVGVDSDLEIKALDGDSKILTVDPYANYETTVAEGVVAGVESDLEVKAMDEESNTLTVNPYVDAETTLTEGLVATFDANYEIKAVDGDAKTLNITPTVTYTAIPNVTAGVQGIEDEIEDDESYMIQSKDSADNLAIAAEVYANYEVVPMEGLTTGVENTLSLVSLADTDSLDKSATINPYVNYEMPLAENLKLVSENNYEMVYDNEELNGTLNLMGGVNYTF